MSLRRQLRAGMPLSWGIVTIGLVLGADSEAVRADEPGLAGHWLGAIETPGEPLSFDVDFSKAANGSWQGDISIPAQGARDLPLAKLIFRDPELSFELSGVPGNPAFKGKLDAKARKISGTFAQGGKSLAFHLEAGTDPILAAKQALAGFDSFVTEAIKAWEVPGLAVAIVKDGEVVFAQGFGLRDVAHKLPVTPKTLFAIGSCTKAFTTFVLGTLVDEGKLDWDTPVRVYIPEFRLFDRTATEQMTPRDLVTHRSGLPRHDLLNGQVTHFNMADFLNNVHSTVFPNAPAGTLYPGDPGFDTGGRPNLTSWLNFAPRLGIAFDPKGDGKTLIRASWGIFYDMPHTLFYYNYASEPLWGSSVTITNPQGGFANPWLGYPGGNPFPTHQNASSKYPTAGYYETVPLHVKNTYVEQWNLTLQRQFGSSWLLKASYLGNNTVHLWTDQELNPAVYIPGNCAAGQFGLRAGGPCSTTGTTQARRLFTQLNPSQGPFYGTVESLDDGGTASYNALIVSTEHRFAKNFSMLANYTFAHCIADPQTTELSGPIYTNPADRRFDRGNCTAVDVRHNFNLSAVIQSPHYNSRVLQIIAGDWQLAPIVGMHTSNYYTVATGVDSALSGVSTTGPRPNLVQSDPYCANRNVNCWLNFNAFGAPAPATLGNLGINSLTGPGYFDLDLALSRRFKIRERQTIEIRTESFNLENRANFLNPAAASLVGGTVNNALNSSTFGKIQSDVSPRIMQFAVKYAF